MVRRSVSISVVVLVAGVIGLSHQRPALSEAGDMTRISVGTDGGEPSGSSFAPAVSADGTRVAFISGADNLTVGDTNGVADVFLYDSYTRHILRVSLGANGAQANGGSHSTAISADGRYVSFWSSADNLVPGDTNGTDDIFVYDTSSGTTTRASVGSSGTQPNAPSRWPSISSDGRYVIFETAADNLVAGDTNTTRDVFLHDRVTEETVAVSVNLNGVPGNHDSDARDVSADGRFVTFTSYASDLTSGDEPVTLDVFVRDMLEGTTIRISPGLRPVISADGGFVAFQSLEPLSPKDFDSQWDVYRYDMESREIIAVSVNSTGDLGNYFSENPAISGDGRFVTFNSAADNLVPGDDNELIDLFVHDTDTGTTDRIAVELPGFQLADSEPPAMSDDGRFIAFSSGTPLVPDDTNDLHDIYLYQHLSLGRFVDDDGSVFEDDIDAIAAAGITRGCNPPHNDRFCPDDPVTRGQMAALLNRALDLDPGPDTFTDTSDSVFTADIGAFAAAGITRGCNPPSNTQFCPNDVVTRGQMAAFLVRALGYSDNAGGDLFVDDDDSVFESDIDRLGTAGVTKGCNPPGNDRFCPNDPVTRGQMAAFLRRALGG